MGPLELRRGGVSVASGLHAAMNAHHWRPSSFRRLMLNPGRQSGKTSRSSCSRCIAQEPTHELDAVHVAFLVAVDQEPKVERVIDDLAREWEGRIDVQLLGPMAAYDFGGTAQSES